MKGDFRVGETLVQPRLNLIRTNGGETRLEPKAIAVLLFLAEQPGQVVSKDELIDAVWEGSYVTDHVLTNAISELRKAFADSPQRPQIIQTIPRKGYRLIAPVWELPDTVPDQLFEGREPVRPYPGLASFSEEQAEFFFGREAEVEALWEKLRRSSLLGLIGSTGSGKTSFLRAGLVPAAPRDWSVVPATPGSRPWVNLAEGLARKLPGDADRVGRLLRFEEPDQAVALVADWRRRHAEVLIILDQFEELFTLNPAQVQKDFADLLERLVAESGARLLLSMRDDFLLRCHGLEPLEPIFADLTPIAPPAGTALKRALVEPAARCGYAFEDDRLVAEILDDVEGERGALPLLAFAASQLWDRRDREGRLLTREAYAEIGAVAGALSQHAEATLEKIGRDRTPLVRELFRNLVTAQGTRAVQEREDLLTVFDDKDRPEAECILAILLDARLLVSYRGSEVEGSKDGVQRVEIVHESLLTHWPRLVRWQAQDREGATLRDELRQAARLWDQHGRSEDLLWTGTAVREYELWREQYPGGLSELEGAFGEAMTSLARSRTRLRRLAFAATLLLALIVALTSAALWRRAESEAQRATDEAQRAEAAHLLALGQLERDSHPTAAVAYATRSLELADTEVARRLVVEILSQVPIALTRPTRADALYPLFSPDGEWLVLDGWSGLHELWRSDGSTPADLSVFGKSAFVRSYFSEDSRFLVSWDTNTRQKEVRVWRLPELTEANRLTVGPEDGNSETVASWPEVHPQGIHTVTRNRTDVVARLMPFEGGKGDVLATWSLTSREGRRRYRFVDGECLRAVAGKDNRIYVMRGFPSEESKERLLATVPNLSEFWFLPDGKRLATHDQDRIRFWHLESEDGLPERVFGGVEKIGNRFEVADRSANHWMGVAAGEEKTALLWDLQAPAGTEPLRLRRGADILTTFGLAMHPEGKWVATADRGRVSLWPLHHRYPRVLWRGPADHWLVDLAVDPGGRWVAATGWTDSRLLLWGLDTSGEGLPKTLLECPRRTCGCAVSPDGRFIAVGDWGGVVTVVPVEGGPVREFTGFHSALWALAFDSSGTRLAAAGGEKLADDAVIRVWDLRTDEVMLLDPGDGKAILWLRFAGEGQLYSSGPGGLRSWDLQSGSSRLLVPDRMGRLSPDSRYYLAGSPPRVVAADLGIHDLESGERWSLASHGDIYGAVWHPSGEAVITTTASGAIQVGPVTGEAPHLLYGHSSQEIAVQTDPTGKWIFSVGREGTLQMRPMPDLSRPPLHTLPHGELLEKLYSLTNLRAVQDDSSPNGYRLILDDFPGWQEVPDW